MNSLHLSWNTWMWSTALSLNIRYFPFSLLVYLGFCTYLSIRIYNYIVSPTPMLAFFIAYFNIIIPITQSCQEYELRDTHIKYKYQYHYYLAKFLDLYKKIYHNISIWDGSTPITIWGNKHSSISYLGCLVWARHWSISASPSEAPQIRFTRRLTAGVIVPHIGCPCDTMGAPKVTYRIAGICRDYVLHFFGYGGSYS